MPGPVANVSTSVISPRISKYMSGSCQRRATGSISGRLETIRMWGWPIDPLLQTTPHRLTRSIRLASTPHEPVPNFRLLVTDQHCADFLGCYGDRHGLSVF